jgi:hypothetical protein
MRENGLILQQTHSVVPTGVFVRVRNLLAAATS